MHSFLYIKSIKHFYIKRDHMKNYKNILVMVVLSSSFFIEGMDQEMDKKEGDSGSVVYLGSSSDSESDGERLDGALLKSKRARSTAELGTPLRRLSAIGSTQEPLVRRSPKSEFDVPGLHATAAGCTSSDLKYSADESDVSRHLAVRPPIYPGAPAIKSMYPAQIRKFEAAAAAPAVAPGHSRSRSYAEVFDSAGIPVSSTKTPVSNLSTVPESGSGSDSDEDSLDELVARLEMQKKSFGS